VRAATVDRFASDILVNNAALYGDWDMSDQSYDYLKKMIDVNQHSVWLMSHAAAPKMVDGGGGRIINQASGAAYNYVSPFRPEEFNGMGTFNYQMSKWGVVGLTKFMAGSLGTWGITVNCIAPGVIDTEATLKVVPAELIATLAARQTVPGQLHAEHLTGTAVFFTASDGAVRDRAGARDRRRQAHARADDVGDRRARAGSTISVASRSIVDHGQARAPSRIT
jgi:3-oxoacyl-[acyl-carrier protein] reductase